MERSNQDTLLSQQAQKQTQLSEAQQLASSYNKKASEIRAIYEQLKVKKDTAIANRNSYANFTNNYYQDFRGKNYSTFKYVLDEAIIQYNAYVHALDRNLDALNNEKERLQGLALDQEGLIGQIKKALNWIGTQLENVTN